MRIALDAAGSEQGTQPIVEGALQAARELGCEITLVGPARELEERLRALGADRGRIEVVDAPRSSTEAAAELVAQDRAQALVSAAPSGTVVEAALAKLKRAPGVLLPAIAIPFPTARGTSVILDAGAGMGARPWHLLQFAVMGTLYARRALKIAEPTIGLLSDGRGEDGAGETIREALPLLRYSGLNFHGLVEGQDIPAGSADVIVCDGFVGRACAKLMEGMTDSVFAMLDSELRRHPLHRLGGSLIRPALLRLRERLSPEERGGAPLLGVGGAVVLCLGRLTPRAVSNAHRTASALAEAGIKEPLSRALEQIKDALEVARGEED